MVRAIQQSFSEVDYGSQPHAGGNCGHLVQFYHEDNYLHSILSGYFAQMLQYGDTAMAGMALGRPATIRHMEEILASSNYACEGVVDQEGRKWTESEVGSRTTMGRFYKRGQRRFLLAYAEPVLAVCVPGRELFARKFRKTVHALLIQLQPDELADTGQKIDHSQLPFYVFGELVDVLCSRGQHLIALELETHWNGIMASYNMTLLCGYRMESFQGSMVDNIFRQVCRHHGTVGPTEAYSQLDTTAKKLEMVASLQQKVMAFNAAQDSHWSNEDAKERIKHREQFVDVLCHELRNPVSGIMGNVELLQMGLDVRREIFTGDNKDTNISEEDIALLKKQLSDDYASVDAIATCAEHMKSVSDDVLNLSKLEKGKVVLVNVLFDLKATIASVIKMFLSAARKKGLRLLAKLPEDDLRVIGDRGRIAQVLINLISNAIKFTSSGHIIVSITCLGPAVVGGGISVFKIAVTDTGCGLTQDEISALFQRFVQPISAAVAEHAGSGLGLYISKNLAELMGGLLYVESRKGEGSMFVFTFQAEPCAVAGWTGTSLLPPSEAAVVDYTDMEMVSRQSSVTSDSSSSESTEFTDSSDVASTAPSTISSTLSDTPSTATLAHVLVVDDNPIILRTLTRILESSNNKSSSSSLLTTNLTISVTTASNGYEALSKLISSSTTSTPISLILMDLEMPFLDGLSTMREIRRITHPDENVKGLRTEQKRTANWLRGIKVVGLTGHGSEEKFVEAREAGMVECLRKPVGRGNLLALVERVMGETEADEKVEEQVAGKDRDKEGIEQMGW